MAAANIKDFVCLPLTCDPGGNQPVVAWNLEVGPHACPKTSRLTMNNSTGKLPDKNGLVELTMAPQHHVGYTKPAQYTKPAHVR